MPLYTRPVVLSTATPGVVSGTFQPPSGILGAGSAAITVNQASWMPVDVPVARAISGLAVNVGTASAGGTTVALRLGLYSDDGTLGRPGALLVDAGAVTITATGIQTATVAVTLPAGRYWAAAAYTYASAPTTAPQIFQASTMIGFPGATFTNSYRCWVATTGVTAGSMPVFATSTTATSVNGGIVVALRIT